MNKIFPEGLFFNPKHENAPEFVKGSVSVHVDKFLNFINDNPKLIDDKGYIKFDLLNSKNNKLYFVVNEFGLHKEEF